MVTTPAVQPLLRVCTLSLKEELILNEIERQEYLNKEDGCVMLTQLISKRLKKRCSHVQVQL